ncbi:tRNA (adenosine(37)-N6)-dimethylallyltransferase MiaA [Chitinispirillales bacterium ANBcel5]|uniref:tRNA (adenosine(37)-N6)-dimethylallyltransferase MiaA n=1 Tax=Cellulosispirillum alkaliphilum TaxID=3039283 RepID=UPI002A4E30F4|nr:tRNA (adenosine(37)-N6)-dimethylallyltransferase MiaA [Chitinispirillales bacterium ANBcel5]
MFNCVVVCGPTASGKTRLGVQIAILLDGEIISVDSRQVYKGMDIGTGKDLDEYQTERGSIPYHLIDIAHPSQIYTLYDYQRDFYHCFNQITKRKKSAIAVGGTGLYLEAVLKHYTIPPVPENPELRKHLMLQDKEQLIEQLKKENSTLFNDTDLSSKKRIVRALEVARASLGEKQKLSKPSIAPLILYVTWEREKLKERIELRLKSRLESGMIEEVSRLIENGITQERLELFGMEYRYIARYLLGECDYQQMYIDLRQSIFRLAKRQNTWFRGMERRGFSIKRIEEGNLDEACRILEDSSLFNRTNHL